MHIQIRVADDVKARLVEAARRLGKSLSSFVLDAAQREAERITRKQRPAENVFMERVRGAQRGGEGGYMLAGLELARSLPCRTDWKDHKAQLLAVLKRRHAEDIWQWFLRTYPKEMAHVPQRRRESFIAGVHQAAREGSFQ